MRFHLNHSVCRHVSRLLPVIAWQSAGSTCASTFTFLSVLPVVIVFASSSVSATFSNSDIVEYHANSLGLHLCLRVCLDVNHAVATTPSVSECPSVECLPVVWSESVSGSLLCNTLACTSPSMSSSTPLG